MTVCDSAQKPLVLFHLIHSVGITNALVFTKSTESTLRLVRLFEFFETARSTSQGSVTQHKEPVVMQAYSSDLSASERKLILEKFRAQEIDVSAVTHLSDCGAVVDVLFPGSSALILYHVA
jgi:ATP-dependent RNA helicase DDX51/DBP6